MKEFAFYSGVVSQFIVTILLFSGAGYLLEKKYTETQPYLVLVFSLLGIGIAMYSIIKQIVNKQK